MTEVFCSLAEMDSAIAEDDKVVYLLASLPELFDMLVMALEACPEVPKMEKMDVVTEKLLHKEWKLSDHGGADCTPDRRLLFAKFCEWKAMVELATGRKWKVLRSDNGVNILPESLWSI